MTEYKGIEYLRKKLNMKQTRVDLRYKYYEMKNMTHDLSLRSVSRISMKYWDGAERLLMLWRIV